MKNLYSGWLSVAALVVACLSFSVPVLADGYHPGHELTGELVVWLDLDLHVAPTVDIAALDATTGTASHERLPGLSDGMRRQSAGSVPALAMVNTASPSLFGGAAVPHTG